MMDGKKQGSLTGQTEIESSVKEKLLEDLLLNQSPIILTDFDTVYGSSVIQPEMHCAIVVDGWEVELKRPNRFIRWVQKTFLGITWKKR